MKLPDAGVEEADTEDGLALRLGVGLCVCVCVCVCGGGGGGWHGRSNVVQQHMYTEVGPTRSAKKTVSTCTSSRCTDQVLELVRELVNSMNLIQSLNPPFQQLHTTGMYSPSP